MNEPEFLEPQEISNPDEVSSFESESPPNEQELEPGRQEKLMEEMVKLLEAQANQIEKLTQAVERLTEQRDGVQGVEGAAEEDYSDLYNTGKSGRAYRDKGKFLSNHQKALIEENADLIRDNLPETEPGTNHIEVEQEESSEVKVAVKQKGGGRLIADNGARGTHEPKPEPEAKRASGGRLLTREEIDNYPEHASKIVASMSAEAPDAESSPEDEAAEPEAEEESVESKEAKAKVEAENEAEAEEARKWYDSAKDMFSPSYWAARWTVHTIKARERGELDPDMTDVEKQEVLKKRRRNKILGRTATVVGLAAGLAGALYIAKQGGSPDGVPDFSGDMGDLSDISELPSDPVDTGEVTADDLFGEYGGEDVDASGLVEAADEAQEFMPDPVFDIPDGGGGERLFQALDIEPREWYNVQFDLLDKFPNSFYRMADGNVGISSPGMLPQEVQEYIKNLK